MIIREENGVLIDDLVLRKPAASQEAIIGCDDLNGFDGSSIFVPSGSPATPDEQPAQS